MTDERDREELRDRQMIELLNELRVALPGVQFLFGFLLTVPFAARFGDATSFQRAVFGVVVVLTALSSACLIAPSAAHRIRFHQGDRPWLIESASRLLLAGLSLMGLAITGAVLLVLDFVFDGVGVWLAVALVAGAIAGLWFVRPLLRR